MSDKMKSLGRRNFLRKGATGIAAISAAPALLSNTLMAKQTNNKENEIIKRKLGNTGIEIPIVSMGVMNADNPNLVNAAYDSGITHFDTAHYYQRGRNEEMVGRVMKGKDRDSFFIATKVPGNGINRDTGEMEIEMSQDEYIEKFETSLKRLQMDYVDILYLHSCKGKEQVLFEDQLKTMVKLKEQGKVRHIGVSTHRNEPEVIQAAIDSKLYEVILTAYNFRQDHHLKVLEAVEKASKAGLGIVAMKTQAGVYWDEEEQHKINMKAALKWALQNPNVHTSIPGFTTFDQLNEDLEVLSDLTISEGERKDLQKGEEFGWNGIYCTQCESCKTQCREKMDIPTLMRSYMYAFGYKNLQQAKLTFNEAGMNDLPCANCESCDINCTMGFDVKQKLMKIDQIRNLPEIFLT